MSPIIKIIVSMIIWGSIGVFRKYIELPSMELAFLRAVIASVFLGLVFPRFKSKSGSAITKGNMIPLILSGFAIGLNWVLLFNAYNYTTVSNATLSYYFAPIFVILLSPIVLKEELTKSKILATIVAMLGLFLIVNSEAASGSSFNHTRGIGFGLMAACLYSSVVLLNKYIDGVSSYLATLTQMSSAALVLFPFIIIRNSIQIKDSRALILIVILGLVHTGLAYLLYFSGIKGLKAQSAAILSYMDPITAVVFGTTILGEPLGLPQVLGGILILGSTFWGERN